MKRRQAPWWLYVVASSFCGYVALTLYPYVNGPERVGITFEFSNERMMLRDVLPNSLGARAGLQPGDRIVAVEGQAIRSGPDWVAMRANFEIGSPRRLEIELWVTSLQLDS